MRAIFAVDGGNATGLAWGIFNDQAGSVEDALAGRHEAGSATLNHRVRRNGKMVVEEPLTDEEQIARIYRLFVKFKRTALDDGLDPLQVELVIEDFILMPGVHAGGKDGVASVRIGWGLTGLMMGIAALKKADPAPSPIWQAPSLMSYATDERLKRWGIWIPGRDHERAAWKHVAARLNKILK